MKVSVCAHITYWYEADIPDDTVDFETAADSEDPVYGDISRILHEKLGNNYEGEISSVVDANTDEEYYVGW